MNASTITSLPTFPPINFSTSDAAPRNRLRPELVDAALLQAELYLARMQQAMAAALQPAPTAPAAPSSPSSAAQ